MSLTVRGAVYLGVEAEVNYAVYRESIDIADKANAAYAVVAQTVKHMYATAPDELRYYAADKNLIDGGINLRTLLGNVLISAAFEAGDAEIQNDYWMEFGRRHFQNNIEGYWELALLEDRVRTAERLLGDSSQPADLG